MSLHYPVRRPPVNLGGPPAPDPYERGQPCPECDGRDTFYYHDPAGLDAPEFVCVSCIKGEFDMAAPPKLCGRVIGHVGPAGAPIAVIEIERMPDGLPLLPANAAARDGRRRGRRGA